MVFTSLPEPASQWHYRDGGHVEFTGDIWMSNRFSDTEWKTGAGVFAAPGAVNADKADVVLDMDADGDNTYYFRRDFRVECASDIQRLTGSIRYSGAVWVYLNGELIFAANVPEDAKEEFCPTERLLMSCTYLPDRGASAEAAAAMRVTVKEDIVLVAGYDEEGLLVSEYSLMTK